MKKYIIFSLVFLLGFSLFSGTVFASDYEVKQLVGDTLSELRTPTTRFTLRQGLGTSDMSTFHTYAPITVKGKASTTLDIADGFAVSCPTGERSIIDNADSVSYDGGTFITTVVLDNAWFKANANCEPDSWTHLIFAPNTSSTGQIYGSASSTYENGIAQWFNNEGAAGSADANIADTYFSISQEETPLVLAFQNTISGQVDTGWDYVVSIFGLIWPFVLGISIILGVIYLIIRVSRGAR